MEDSVMGESYLTLNFLFHYEIQFTILMSIIYSEYKTKKLSGSFRQKLFSYLFYFVVGLSKLTLILFQSVYFLVLEFVTLHCIAASDSGSSVPSPIPIRNMIPLGTY